MFFEAGYGQHGNMSLGIFLGIVKKYVQLWFGVIHPIQLVTHFVTSFQGASATRAESHAGGTTANAAQSADPFKPEGSGRWGHIGVLALVA